MEKSYKHYSIENVSVDKRERIWEISPIKGIVTDRRKKYNISDVR